MGFLVISGMGFLVISGMGFICISVFGSFLVLLLRYCLYCYCDTGCIATEVLLSPRRLVGSSARKIYTVLSNFARASFLKFSFAPPSPTPTPTNTNTVVLVWSLESGVGQDSEGVSSSMFIGTRTIFSL